MYVCNCRGLRPAEIREALRRDDAQCPLGVHAACETTPKCGRCLVDMADYLREARGEAAEAAQSR